MKKIILTAVAVIVMATGAFADDQPQIECKDQPKIECIELYGLTVAQIEATYGKPAEIKPLGTSEFRKYGDASMNISFKFTAGKVVATDCLLMSKSK